MNVLVHPTYFPNVAHFVAIVKAKKVTFEVCDNFQKQTYRNRTYIYGANGNLQLSVPIIHSHKNRQLTKDVKIYNEDKWQLNHWKSLESAYRTSPYFEFYEDEFKPLFSNKATHILDFNLKCLEVVFDCLQLEIPIDYTTVYEKTPEKNSDYRYLANARTKQEILLNPYTQVFNSKHGYINNLSILDLLFNEGTNALSYLEAQELP